MIDDFINYSFIVIVPLRSLVHVLEQCLDLIKLRLEILELDLRLLLMLSHHDIDYLRHVLLAALALV